MNLDEVFESSQQSFESLTLDSGNGHGKHRLSSNFDDLSDLSQPDFAEEDEVGRYYIFITQFYSTVHSIHFRRVLFPVFRLSLVPRSA